MIVNQRLEKAILIESKLTGVSKPICSVTKTVNLHVCDNCGNAYERKGIEGFFEQMFTGCPNCGHDKDPDI